jgi:hypothetical protein
MRLVTQADPARAGCSPSATRAASINRRRWRAAGALAALLAVAGAAGCSGGSAVSPTPRRTEPPLSSPSTAAASRSRRGQSIAKVLFVPVALTVRRECEETATAVGYAVPCPTMLPLGMAPTPGVLGCQLAVIGPADLPACGGAQWRGWIVGSIQGDAARTDGFQHLALVAAPRVVANPARAIDGPPMIPGSRVEARGVERIGGSTMHWYFVPPDRNIGSGFMDHLVLVWSFSGHTYAYGFHVVNTFAQARALDRELARHLVTVEPRPGR